MADELLEGLEGEEQEKELDEYLAFFSDKLRFAVSAKFVTEIITTFTITTIPGVPEYIRGIFNLRGQVVPIVDARRRMRQPNGDEDEPGKCVIVLNNEIGEVSMGLYVDSVSQVVNIKDEDILPPPANNRQELVSGIVHIGEDDYLILDCARLIGK